MTCREKVAPHWQARLLAAGLTQLADLLTQSPDNQRLAGSWETLTKPNLGGRERWRWVLANGQIPNVVYLKRYAHTPFREQLDRIRRQSITHSRAWWEFRQSERLIAAHIPAPQPVGFVERMRGAFERQSAVLLECVNGDAFDRIWRCVSDQDAPITRAPARHDLAKRLGRFIAAFHGTGFCHRDLYLCHVFADLDPEAGRPPEFTLIDLARMHRPRWRRMRWILKDLSQLDASARQINASRPDRLRGLLAYLGLQSVTPRVRWYVRRIVRKSDCILRRIERKARSS